MAKKSFSKLGQGSEKLSDNLQAFLIKDDDSQVHPDTSILDITKETIKEQSKPKAVKKVVKKEAPVIAKIKQVKKPEVTPGPKVKKEQAKELPKMPQKSKPVLVAKAKPAIEEPADDFRSHSVLFSDKQLSELQDKVLMRKIQSDRKYSVKKALNEAFTLWLEHKGIVETGYPEDFKTYTALFSEKQLNSVQDKVYMHKAKEDRGYSLKKALYEAVQLYLSE